MPLWLAIRLRKGDHCRLLTPSWLSKEYLMDVLRKERENLDDFQELPFHYVEIASMIIDSCSDDLPDCGHCRLLVQEIREQRNSKILNGLPTLDGNPLKLNNVGQMELNEIRPFLLGALDNFSLFSTANLEEKEKIASLRYEPTTYTLNNNASFSGGTRSMNQSSQFTADANNSNNNSSNQEQTLFTFPQDY